MDERGAIRILEKYVENKKVLNSILTHSSTVKQIAVSIAKKINSKEISKKKADLNLIKVGSLLHDIGRIKYPPSDKNSLQHGIEGEKILLSEVKIMQSELKELNKKEKTENMEKRIERLKSDILLIKKCAKICRNHIAVGLYKKDIIKKKLPLPKVDFVPRGLEQQIIAYSDNLIDKGRLKDINFVIENYGNWLGDEYKDRIINMHKKLHKLMGDTVRIEKKTKKVLSVILF